MTQIHLVYQKTSETLIHVSASGGSDPPLQKEKMYNQDAEEVIRTIEKDVTRLLEEEQNRVRTQHNISPEKLELLAILGVCVAMEPNHAISISGHYSSA
ncbi:hypothetical protein [Brevibacillus laterosporus]|uniref:Uncharacterized protein n=2 Tax=Brevibacillus laterosporus TaxID=1465 RepID=A0AAP3DLH5_BRELA|nr:hypothetical protein [Brevibacillus laterosporus]MCR8982661.1 hypothetical protein [Brevibacillus laterosporus]MCZ0809817.1 hypothetical protein [Brevibacillus laterosporus]MCZ0823926.1 hypothetical protein [Brevibacillus laterosporus]MCZ0852454.1 hypothetical protein [Brevibacillus laterosporus]